MSGEGFQRLQLVWRFANESRRTARASCPGGKQEILSRPHDRHREGPFGSGFLPCPSVVFCPFVLSATPGTSAASPARSPSSSRMSSSFRIPSSPGLSGLGVLPTPDASRRVQDRETSPACSQEPCARRNPASERVNEEPNDLGSAPGRDLYKPPSPAVSLRGSRRHQGASRSWLTSQAALPGRHRWTRCLYLKADGRTGS